MPFGSDLILKKITKGATQKRIAEVLHKAHDCGIKVSATVILELGGNTHSEEHIDGTIALLNSAPVTYLSTLQLYLDKSIEDEFYKKFGEPFEILDDMAILKEQSGIFAPSLAIGAGMGSNLAEFMPYAPASAVVLLGMVAYFSGVVQAPITAFVIVMEMTDNHDMVIPLMAAAIIASVTSRMVCHTPLYKALAENFLRRANVTSAPATVLKTHEEQNKEIKP